ncbi:hypothetical protein ACO0QE_000788 [Hanseniaspora vineae]
MPHESPTAPFNLCTECLPSSEKGSPVTLYKDTDTSHRCKMCTSYFTNYSNRKLGHCLLDIQLHVPMDLRDEIFAQLGLDKDYKHLTDNMKNIKSEIMKRYIHDQNSKLLAKDKDGNERSSIKIDYTNVVMPRIKEKLDQTNNTTKADPKPFDPNTRVEKIPIPNIAHFKKLFASVLDPATRGKPASQPTIIEQSSDMFLLLFNISRQTAEWEILKSLNENYKIINSQIRNFNCKQSGSIALLQCTASVHTALQNDLSSEEAFFTMSMGGNSSKIYVTPISQSQYAQINKFLSNATYQELNSLSKFINFSVMNILKKQSKTPLLSVKKNRRTADNKAKQNKVTKKGKRTRHNLGL